MTDQEYTELRAALDDFNGVHLHPSLPTFAEHAQRFAARVERVLGDQDHEDEDESVGFTLEDEAREVYARRLESEGYPACASHVRAGGKLDPATLANIRAAAEITSR